MSKKPDPYDIDVGRRIRARRMFRAMSQTQLGEKLGITFQQVQKYEKGTNRVSAGRLKRIAEILDVSVSYFFSLPNTTAPDTADVLGFVNNARALRLMRAYSRIQNSHVQRVLLDLTEEFALSDTSRRK
jgi:transcriptional regulator with XRE-family HTH domain